MSIRLSRFCSLAAPAFLAACLLWGWGGRAAEPQRGRPIEFSDPRSAEITTNLNQLSSKRGGLRELEADLFKPLQSLSVKGSLDGVEEAPPVGMRPGPRGLTKKERERLEQRRNWYLNSPDDLTRGPTVEEIFNLPDYGPDGKEKSKKTPIEKYYERLDRERLRERGSLKQDDSEGRERSQSADDLKEEDDHALPGGLTEQERTMRRLFDSQPSSVIVAPEPKSSFADVFGLGNPSPSPEQLESSKLTMQQFRQLLESGPKPVTGFEQPNSLSGLSSGLPAPALGGLDAFNGASLPGGNETTSGTMSPALGVSGLPDLSPKGPEPLAPSSAASKVEMTKVPRPPSMMDFPQRKF